MTGKRENLFRRLRSFFLRAMGRHLTEEEIHTLIREGEEEGVIDRDEHAMIDAVLDLEDTRVRGIMRPRTDIFALEKSTPLDEAIALVVREEHSRIPVYEEDLDHVVGILFAKDLLRHWGKRTGELALTDLLRPAFFIPESKPVRDLLTEFKVRRVHMAIVVDEYGGTAGLVTIEDVLEEIVGEIRDEYDTDEPVPVVRHPDGRLVFDARTRIEEVERETGILLPRGGFETLGGFLGSRMGRVPGRGEQVRDSGLLLTVEEADDKRATRIRVERLPEEEG